MRRVVGSLLFFFLSIGTACANESVSLTDVDVVDGVVDAVDRDIPRLSIESSASDLSSIRVEGKLENAKLPAQFRLRTANGCMRDTQIAATAVGTEISLALHEQELADAFACVVDADVGDTTLASITVTPDADVIATSSASLRIDTFSVASIDLEPPPLGGQTVRIAFMSTDPASINNATMNILGTTIVGLASPAEDEGTRITFEVPSRTWARAAIANSDVTVHVSSSRIELRPTVRVELLGEDDAPES